MSYYIGAVSYTHLFVQLVNESLRQCVCVCAHSLARREKAEPPAQQNVLITCTRTSSSAVLCTDRVN